MATIIPLALKIQADVQDVLDKFGSIPDSVQLIENSMSNLGKVVDKSKVNLSNMGNSFDVLNTGIQASKRLEGELNALQQMGRQNTQTFLDTQNAALNTNVVVESMFNTMVKQTQKAAIELHGLPPTIDNIEKAMSMLGNMKIAGNDNLIKGIVGNFGEFDKAIVNTETSIMRFFGRLVDDTKNVVPELENIHDAIQRMRDIEAQGVSFDNRTGQTNHAEIESLIKQSQHYTDQVLVKMAEGIRDLPQSFDSVRDSMQQLNDLQQNVATDFNLLPPDQVQHIDAFKAGITDLASSVGNDIGKLEPTFKNLKNSISRITELRDLSADFYTLTGGTHDFDNAIQNAHDSYSELAMDVADKILEINPSIDGVMKARTEFEKLRNIIDEFREASGDAAERAAQKTEMLKNVTESYKNSLKEILDYHTKTADIMDKMREAALTPAQRASQRQQELQNAINEPTKLQNDIDRLQTEIENRKKLIANTRDTETKDSLTERNNEAIETLKKMQELQSKIKPLTKVEIEVRQKEIIQLEMKERGIGKYQNQTTAAQTLQSAVSNINAMFDAGKIDYRQLNEMLQNAAGEFMNFIGVSQSPLEAFHGLTDQLNSVKDVLSPNDFKSAKQKLLDDLRKGLGVDKYFDQSDTVTAKKELLDKMRENIRLYAKEAGLKEDDIKAAEEKLQTEVKSQGELGSVWQDVLKAREAAKSVDQKISEINIKIDTAAEAGLYDAKEAAEMKKTAEAKIRENNKSESTKEQKANNEVLVRGTVAYTNYQNQNSSQEHLRSIRDNSKKQTELLAKNVQVTENLGKSLANCFEVV
jgi:DNA repair exonuclease SbcCD ATPase subunit